LRKLGDFNLIGVTASREMLIKRMMERGRDSEKKLTEAEIIEKLEREGGKGEPESGQQITKCFDLSDFTIINNGTFVELEAKLDHFVGLLTGKARPSFDEIFMEISYAWAKRATCLRRKVGAVLAKDKQQLTAGYNGAPRGLPHCAELGGCLREKLGIPSGQRHELCRGTHAEQNAITQAAKFGINIEGATLYCNTYPCVICTKMILNAGIKRVVYDSSYDDALSRELLGSQKILEVVRYEGKKFKC
jgi:dCMP deaminase